MPPCVCATLCRAAVEEEDYDLAKQLKGEVDHMRCVGAWVQSLGGGTQPKLGGKHL